MTLEELSRAVAQCQRCPLRMTATQPVPDLIVPDCEYFLLGEAPGRDEDKAGTPFVGAAGKRLNVLVALTGIDLNKCSVGNVVRCRPPSVDRKQREPRKAEIRACIVWLRRALAIAQPKTIITLGRIPLSLFSRYGIKQMHGTQFEFDLDVEFICLRTKKKGGKDEDTKANPDNL